MTQVSIEEAYGTSASVQDAYDDPALSPDEVEQISGAAFDASTRTGMSLTTAQAYAENDHRQQLITKRTATLRSIPPLPGGGRAVTQTEWDQEQQANADKAAKGEATPAPPEGAENVPIPDRIADLHPSLAQLYLMYPDARKALNDPAFMRGVTHAAPVDPEAIVLMGEIQPRLEALAKLNKGREGQGWIGSTLSAVKDIGLSAIADLLPSSYDTEQYRPIFEFPDRIDKLAHSNNVVNRLAAKQLNEYNRVAIEGAIPAGVAMIPAFWNTYTFNLLPLPQLGATPAQRTMGNVGGFEAFLVPGPANKIFSIGVTGTAALGARALAQSPKLVALEAKWIGIPGSIGSWGKNIAATFAELKGGELTYSLFTPENLLRISNGEDPVEVFQQHLSNLFHFDPTTALFALALGAGKSLNAALPEVQMAEAARRVALGKMRLDPKAADAEIVKAYEEIQTGTRTVAPTELPTAVSPVAPESVSGIKNAYTEARRAELGLPERTRPEPQSQEGWLAQAREETAIDPDRPRQVEEDLRADPRTHTPLEAALLDIRAASLDAQLNTVFDQIKEASSSGDTAALDALRKRSTGLQTEYEAFAEVVERAGTEWGRAGVARQMGVNQKWELARMLRDTTIAKGRSLTLDEARKVKLDADVHAELQMKYDALLADKETKALDLAADKAHKEVTTEEGPTAKPRRAPSRPRLVSEERYTAAKARLSEKLSTRLTVGVDPTIMLDLAEIGVYHIEKGARKFAAWSEAVLKDLGENVRPYLKDMWSEAHRQMGPADREAILKRIEGRVAKDLPLTTTGVQDLYRTFWYERIGDHDAIIDAVHGVIKDTMPAITRSEVRIAFAGYGKYRQLSQEAVRKEIRQRSGEEQERLKIEDMANGKAPPKSGWEHEAPTEVRKALIKLVNAAKAEGGYDVTDAQTQLRTPLQTWKARTQTRLAELNRRMEENDFATRQPKPPQLDEDALTMKHELAKVEERYTRARERYRRANRSMPAKVYDVAGEVLMTSRGLMTSFDLSAVLRQGGFLALGHPIRTLGDIKGMMKALMSEEAAFKIDQEIRARPNMDWYARSKLNLTEHGKALSKMEEPYMGRWNDMIPGIAASNRAFSTFLNLQRANAFDSMVKSLGREPTLVEAKALATFINIATGRADFGKFNSALVGLNKVFFAPRLVASRIQLLYGHAFINGSWATRKLIAGEYARTLTALGVVYGLSYMAGAKITFDPTSSDFGKIVIGNTRIDPLFGLAQPIVLVSKSVAGVTTDLKGRTKPIRGDRVPYGTRDAYDYLADFMRAKFNPIFGAGVDVLTGTDVINEPVTPLSAGAKLVIPMSFRDIYEAMLDQGVAPGAAIGILSIFGMGVSTYNTKSKSRR